MRKNTVELEQEPCSNCCNGNQIEKAKLCQKSYLAGMEHKQKPKTGHWINLNEKSAICSCCGRNNILYGDFCKWCGAKMKGEE